MGPKDALSWVLSEDEFLSRVDSLAGQGFVGTPSGPVSVEAIDADERVKWRSHYPSAAGLVILARQIRAERTARASRSAAPMTEPPNELEPKIQQAWTAGDFEAAATVVLEGYGDEILSFLIARLRNPSDGQEAFAMFAEDLWTGLPKFGWRCSMRTWAYTLARNAANRYASAPARKGARNLTLSGPGRLSQLVERVRSATHVYQQTAVKDRVRALREQLDPEDQMLLVLRIDRGMAWRDLAITMAGDADLDDASIERESVRLRKAFERVKTELKRMAEADGLLRRGD
jgi:RNA polymerase sigma-70 factor (ECF subfamily)